MADTSKKIVVFIENFEHQGEAGTAQDLQNRIDTAINETVAPMIFK